MGIWVVVLSSVVGAYRHVEGTCSEFLWNAGKCKTVPGHEPKEHNLNFDCRKDVSYI